MSLKLEVCNSSIIFIGDFYYSDISLFEQKIHDFLAQEDISSIDLRQIVSFDTSLIVFICALQSWIRAKAYKVNWIINENLQVLMALYGLENFFEEK